MKRQLILPAGFAVLVVVSSALPQNVGIADDALGGASKPRTVTETAPDRRTDYKRWGQYAVKRMALGDYRAAEESLSRLLQLAPDDPDLTLLAAAAAAHRGDLEQAETLLRRALELDLPPGRVVVGPPEISEPLAETPTARRLAETFRSEPVHGPMLGAVTDQSAKVWVRTAEPAEVRVVARPADAGDVSPVTAQAETRGDTDRTAVLMLSGLKPRTTYEYRVAMGDNDSAASGTFTTFAPRGEASRFSIAFGGGAGYHPPQERVWTTIRNRRPDAVLLLGDNVYSDDPETPAVQQYSYYRRQSREEFRELFAHVPVFSIWDDHDFGTDDSWGGPLVDVPAWKRPVWETFRQNWVNPAYGGGDSVRGVWYDFAIGSVDFFMLDGRYYRTNPGRFGDEPSETPTMLGPQQNKWLRERLKQSTAVFKVIVSPVPWDFRAKEGRAGLDTWRGFAEEREALFDFLSENEIDGVVLMSADRHRSDAWKIDRDDDYTLYEFNSSRLTNDHVHPTMPEAIFSYNEKQSFGWVTFDTESEEPKVTYEVISIDDEPVHSLTVQHSSLRSGKASGR